MHRAFQGALCLTGETHSSSTERDFVVYYADRDTFEGECRCCNDLRPWPKPDCPRQPGTYLYLTCTLCPYLTHYLILQPLLSLPGTRGCHGPDRSVRQSPCLKELTERQGTVCCNPEWPLLWRRPSERRVWLQWRGLGCFTEEMSLEVCSLGP